MPSVFVDNRFDGLNSLGRTSLETKLIIWIIWRDKNINRNDSKHTFSTEKRKEYTLSLGLYLQFLQISFRCSKMITTQLWSVY